MIHILSRFVLHFACSAFILLAFFYTLRYWLRRNSRLPRWISSDHTHLLITCALLVMALLPLREPYDIWAGNNSFIKSIFDQLSWYIGAACGVWGLHRFWGDR